MDFLLRPAHLEADFARLAPPFVNKLLGQLDARGLTMHARAIDHVCYRVGDVATYEALKRSFAALGTLLSEAFINGRPIAAFKLRRPLPVNAGFVVDVVELPAPKPGAPYSEGFEHIEVVTPTKLKSLLAQNAALPFQTGNLGAAINPDVSLKLDEGVVKFHEKSLEDVIAAEQLALRAAGPRGVAVLDLDDTLVASRAPFLQGIRLALGAHLGRDVSDAEIRMQARPTFPEFFANFGVVDSATTQSVLQEFKRQWSKVEADCSVPLGVHSLLSCLRFEGIQVHVWTARDLPTAESCLAAMGLRPFVEKVHAYDAYSPGKPTPSAELSALCRGVKGIVVGDSPSDQQGSAALGFQFLQAAWVHRAALNDATSNLICCASPLEALAAAMRHFSA